MDGIASLQPCEICMTLMPDGDVSGADFAGRTVPTLPLARKFERASHWSRDKAICI
jgi:hypothetical protein